MTDITKCANWKSCPEADRCARCPTEKEKPYFFGSSFHPYKPWLCFVANVKPAKESEAGDS